MKKIKDLSQGKLTLEMSSQSNGGLSMKTSTGNTILGGKVDSSRVGKFQTIGDEPPLLDGKDLGLSPIEYLLQSLAGCYTASLAILAEQNGIELDDIRINFAADTDLGGVLGLNPNARKGVSQIRADIQLKSATATDAQLDDLIVKLEAFSPLCDTLVNGTQIITKRV
ncbi:OsmC family protein [Neisseria sp. ZJ106]|uniref:OsmC family protein n=1 Tax=Neisseria lisongii TaxID=2912188 RepID=A0ABY7RIU5_9NEIS|nr:OsmC family protein [Neisseria lisongii]MCF7520620.1 OsmC family protein [Neisseria lisongii]WCL71446.1 OsmC family protein [Neisseria lisongii]